MKYQNVLKKQSCISDWWFKKYKSMGPTRY